MLDTTVDTRLFEEETGEMAIVEDVAESISMGELPTPEPAGETVAVVEGDVSKELEVVTLLDESL